MQYPGRTSEFPVFVQHLSGPAAYCSGASGWSSPRVLECGPRNRQARCLNCAPAYFFWIHRRAFDIVKLLAPVNLDDLAEVETKINKIQLFEIKSTNKEKMGLNFRGYFFSLTAAEVLVAQSLKLQFKFALVNTLTKHHIELNLNELFGRAKGIYPAWSILL